MKPAFLLASTSFLLNACGETHHISERYVRDIKNEHSEFEKDVGATHIHQVIHGTRTASGSPLLSVFTDTHSKVSAPYTLTVVAGYYGDTSGTLQVLDVTMSLDGGAPLGLLDWPARVVFNPWLDHAESAKLEIDLADRLEFCKGREVVVTTTFIPPGHTSEETITTVFTGERKETSTSKLKMLLGGS